MRYLDKLTGAWGRRVVIALACVMLAVGVATVFLSCCVRREITPRGPAPKSVVPRAPGPLAPVTTVRKLIAEGLSTLTFAPGTPGRWTVPGSGSTAAAGRSSGPWTVSPAGGGVQVGNIVSGASRAVFEPEGDTFEVLGKTYRGRLIAARGDDGLNLINVLPVEQYLRSVVASEMPGHWPAEALMAQAVSARTYALQRLKKRQGEPWNLTGSDLAYGGVDAEYGATDQAVELTRGVVMTYQGRLVPAYFHSTCGGHTASRAKVFDEPELPPLRGVSCNWCKDSPVYRWEAEISAAHIARSLAPWGVSSVRSLSPQGKPPDGRAAAVLVNGNKSIPANEFRLAVGPRELKSTAFTVRRSGGSFMFKGSGWGHGVGLCQWGAHGLANEGLSWRQILSYYYPGVSFQRAY